jgi:hypothetical protein
MHGVLWCSWVFYLRFVCSSVSKMPSGFKIKAHFICLGAISLTTARGGHFSPSSPEIEMWRDIHRRILAEGKGKRQICREYGIHFRTLQKILENSEPPGYRQSKAREKRKIGSYIL